MLNKYISQLSSLWPVIFVLQGVPACSISRFCYWTRPFDIFNFTVPPIWQVHCTTGLMVYGYSLVSTLKKRGISFLLCPLSVYSSHSFTWASKFARKKHNQTYSIVCDNLFLGHLIIISVNAFYYAVCVLMSLPFFLSFKKLFVLCWMQLQGAVLY